jgi:hypothetical protein
MDHEARRGCFDYMVPKASFHDDPVRFVEAHRHAMAMVVPAAHAMAASTVVDRASGIPFEVFVRPGAGRGTVELVVECTAASMRFREICGSATLRRDQVMSPTAVVVRGDNLLADVRRTRIAVRAEVRGHPLDAGYPLGVAGISGKPFRPDVPALAFKPAWSRVFPLCPSVI